MNNRNMKLRRNQKKQPQSRKELRKEKRLQKKKNRFNYHNVKKNTKSNEQPTVKNHQVKEKVTSDCSDEDEEILSSENETELEAPEPDKLNKFLKRQKAEHDEYFKEIKKNRVEQLKQANEEEDKIIAKYEKLLKLNRRKKKNGQESIPSMGKFNDGLDDLLELCTDDNIQKMYLAAQEAYHEDDSDDLKNKSEKLKKVEEKYFGDDDESDDGDLQLQVDDDDSCDGNDSEFGTDNEEIVNDSNSEISNESDDQGSNEDEVQASSDEDEIKSSNDDDGTWEDIYGRTRKKNGGVIENAPQVYVPPHMRKSIAVEDDAQRKEKLAALRRQIKGHVNRLAESNLHRIAIDIEGIYNSNARNDTTTVLSEVLINSLVSNVLAKERLVLEHTLLIAVLHANVGTEVGAFLLQVLVEKFEALYQQIDTTDVENKELDNIIFIICHLFTFKLFKHNLIYEMLKKLSSKLTEKRIGCILLVLKSIGFILRKEDPLLLKEFIVSTQKVLHSSQQEEEKNSRAAYMMEMLMAIKNNNMTKIPQYDASLVEHFRKLLKQFVRAGNYVTTLAITMDDLLNAKERGKWWLVGSAWAGAVDKNSSSEKTAISSDDKQREKIFALAKKQRMNTDAKRNVFYLLMVAEDYVDAFEKIISSNSDERTIISVILHCCLSEKSFNAFYAVLAQKFSDHNRKFLLAIQFAVWDRIKAIENLSSHQISNLSTFLVHLIVKGNLPLSVLKIVEFSQIDKTNLRFMRQIMMGVLLAEEEEFHKVFERMAPNMKLSIFRDQLRLFLKVFLLKNDCKNMSDEQIELVKARVILAEKYLSSKSV